MNPSLPRGQRGGFLVGLVIGLLIGLAVALGVALYVTKAPNPFVNKVQGRSPGQDAAEIEKNRSWDPNSALQGRNPAPLQASAPTGDTAPPTAALPPLVAPAVIGPSASAASSARAQRPPLGASGNAVGAASAPSRGASQVLATSGADPFSYFVQAGAFARSEDAEQQRAKLALLGVESRLTEREQGGRTVYRVRVGPFEKKEDADAAKERLGDAGVDSALVRVQK
jgi:cell division protein FtsN